MLSLLFNDLSLILQFILNMLEGAFNDLKLIFKISVFVVLTSCSNESGLYSGKYRLQRANDSSCDIELLENAKCIVNCSGQLLFNWSILEDKRLLLTNEKGGILILKPIEFKYYGLQSRAVVWILERGQTSDTLSRI